MSNRNELGQPIGEPVAGWMPPPRPQRIVLEGQWCQVEPLSVAHTAELYNANSIDTTHRMWTYLPYGPFADEATYRGWIEQMALKDDPLFVAIRSLASGEAVGVGSYLRIDPTAGSIEVGHLAFSPLLQRTPAATEALFLLMQHAFALGYRRFEWKCDALNGPSRAAAQRLGLSFEGVFRQATVYKGRNRDTAWYAAIDKEWPALQAAFEQWLDLANFDAGGTQHQSLSALTGPLLARRG